MENKQIIDTLNALIEVCRDGQYGYDKAKENIDNAMVRPLLERFSRRRGEFATELSAQVGNLGGVVEEGSTLMGSLHRGWIELKSALTSGDEASILDECVRGDKAAISAYENALNEQLTLEVRPILEAQLKELQESVERLETLEEMA